jgi:hypothetical protein
MDISGGAKRARQEKDDVGILVVTPTIKSDDLQVVKDAISNISLSIDIQQWIMSLKVPQLEAIKNIFEQNTHNNNLVQIVRLLSKFINELSALEDLPQIPQSFEKIPQSFEKICKSSQTSSKFKP